MNIGIFAKKETISMKALHRALEARGHQVYLINKTYFEPTNPTNIEFPQIDLLYYWNGAGTVGRVCVCDYLRSNGIKAINDAIVDDPVFVNKIYQLYRITQNEILAPQTVTQANASYELITKKIGEPFILKTAVGAAGQQVRLIKNISDFEEATRDFSGRELLYQKFIRNDGDYRVHVIGGKAVCVYKRTPAEGDFRANVSRGGGMEKVEDESLREKLFNIAEKVAKSFIGAEIIGVDIMRDLDDDQLYFIETNELPGIKQVHEVTGIDVADKMVDYFESVAKK